jgi:hypothetical protein
LNDFAHSGSQVRRRRGAVAVASQQGKTGCRECTAGGGLERDRVAAQQFYDYADEHFDWAETAKTGRERSIFLQMAAAWLDIDSSQNSACDPRHDLSFNRVHYCAPLHAAV